MAYIINRYDGSRLIVLDDGILDTSIPVGLVGRNYTGWGEVFNENFVFLLENFRGSSPPTRPLQGQTWYDSTNSVLKAYDENQWNPIGNAAVSEGEPNPTQGGFWLKSTTEQLYVSVNNEWKLVGPEGLEGYGTTRIKSELVIDSQGQDRPVSISYVDGQPISIFSSAAFTLAENFIQGFSQIEVGLNFRSDAVVNGNLKGNADTATAFRTPRNINGVSFDGTQNIVIKSSTTNPLRKGDYIVGSDWDGTLTDTWSVDATPENRIGKVVARDANGEFSAERITANLTGDVLGNVTALSGTSAFSNITATRVTSPDFIGNASTATRLRTARKINTIDFDGTADITLPVPAETLVGNTLAENVVFSSLTSVGKLSSLEVNDTGINVSNNNSSLKILVDQFTPTIRSDQTNVLRLQLQTGSSQVTASDITYISSATTSTSGVTGPSLVPDWNRVVPDSQKINLGLPNNQWNTIYSNNFVGRNLQINNINSSSGQVVFDGSVSIRGSVSSQFVGPLQGNVVGNLTGNVTGSASLNVLKSGDTLTGDINWLTTNRGINWAMNTDSASIRFYNTGDSDPNSRLEFNTGDNGNEYFRWTHNRSGGIGLFESMRLMPNTPGNSVLTVSGNIEATGRINANKFIGIGTDLTNLDAAKITQGRLPTQRLSGSYDINISGNATTVSAITGVQVRNALGYTPSNIAGSTLTGDWNWTSTARGLNWAFNTDGASIRFYNTGDADTDSRLEFETRDNGNEYFRWTHTLSGSGNFELMRLVPNSSGNSALTVRGNIAATNSLSASSISGSGAGITNLNAGNLSAGIVPIPRLSGTYNISVSGNANTVSAITNGQVIGALGYTPVRNTGDTITGDLLIVKPNAWLALDSPSVGPNGTDQAAGISIGESGYKGSATFHITYTGDGFSHIGMGSVDPNTSIMNFRAMRLYYLNNNVDFYGTINVPTVNATTLIGNGTQITSMNASNLSLGTVPIARLAGTYNINITGNAASASTASVATSVSGGTASVSSASVSGRLDVSAGINGGIKFPNDPGGGSGDTASITYEVIGADRTRLRFRVSNDATGSIDDKAEFITPDINGLLVNNNVVLNAANFNNYSPARNGQGAFGTWPINITGQAGTVGSISGNQVIAALGYTPANGSGPGVINGEQDYQFNLLRRPTVIDYALFHNALGSRVGNVVINCQQGNYVSMTAVGAITWSFTNPPTGPRATGIILELTNGGSFTQNWPSSVRWPSGTAPVLTPSGVDVLIFITDDAGANWRGAISMSNSR